jgi:hypothetical protein
LENKNFVYVPIVALLSTAAMRGDDAVAGKREEGVNATSLASK